MKNKVSLINKITALFLTVILLSSAFVSCKSVHEHSFGGWERIKEEDCIFDGEIRRECQCGEVETRTSYALGHLYLNGVCMRCGIEGDSPENNLAKVIFTSRGDGTCAVTGYRDIISGSLIIPERSPKGDLVTEICQNALANHNITDLAIPSSVTVIGDDAFNYCTSLERVTMLGGVTEIGNEAFAGCQSLKAVTLPNTLTVIGDSAFARCGSLKSVNLPDTLTVIGDSAFARCKSLTGITLPNSLNNIGRSAFIGCENLTEINIPDGITVIEPSTFSLCTSLRSIIITSSVTEIKDMAFYKCSALQNIYYKGSDTSWRTIQLLEYNDALKKAAVTYNYTE